MINHHDILSVPANWEKIPLETGIYVVEVVNQDGHAVPLGFSSWTPYTPDEQSVFYPRGASSIVNIGVSRSLQSRAGNKINELGDELKPYKDLFSTDYRLRLRVFGGYEENDVVVEKIIQAVFAMVYGSLPIINGIEGAKEDESKRQRRLTAFANSAKSPDLSQVKNWAVLQELMRMVLEPSLTSPLYGVACQDRRAQIRQTVLVIFKLLQYFTDTFSKVNGRQLFDESKRTRRGARSEGKTPSELLLLLDNTSDYIVQVTGVGMTIGGSTECAVEPTLAQKVRECKDLIKAAGLPFQGVTIGTQTVLRDRKAYTQV